MAWMAARFWRMVRCSREPDQLHPRAVGLALSWGVTPVMSGTFTSTDVLFYHATETAKKLFDLQPGDHIIITGGHVSGVSGNTSLIKVETI